MEKIWEELYNAAKKVQNKREISSNMTAGGVAAAVESESGKIYAGVCIDTSCALGICAERNAIFNMITNGENKIKKVIAVRSNGDIIIPCGACREFMAQLMPDSYKKVEVMMNYNENKVMTLGDLTPYWWI